MNLTGSNCFLVTGAQGFIGSWVIKNLIDMDQEVIALDVHAEPVRLGLVMHPKNLQKIRFVRGDINNLELIENLLGEGLCRMVPE